MKSLMNDKNGVDVDMNVQKIFLPVEDAVSVGLILNETITNSVKHGIKGHKKKIIRLDIHCYTNGSDKIRIIVSDNGSGIQNIGRKKHSGFGYKLIKMLVSNYDGHIKVDNRENKITMELNYADHELIQNN
jgi:two-component sensor histidine kinase